MPVPWISVKSQPIVSVEHPYVVRNIDRGIKSLGGQPKLDEVRSHTLVPMMVVLRISLARQEKA